MRSDQVKEKYDSLAHYYDKRWEGYLRATHEVAIELLEPKLDDIILDASGGTGLLIERIIHMIGEKGDFHLIDISNEMLDKAKDRFQANKNVLISQQDVHHLEFEDNHFSKLLCVSSFHYYAEPHEVLGNFHRVLEPHGVLVLVDWCRDSFHFKLFNVLMKLFSKHHVKIYSSNELGSLVEISNFKVEKLIKFTHGLWKLVGLRATKT